MASVRGYFVWYELMTTDTAAAEEFYTDVVGWTAQDAPMAGMDYTLFSAGEAMIGGLMALPPGAASMGMPPSWLGYIGVDDVDGAVAEVERLGGKLLKAPMDIPEVGRFAVVADPQGAAFAVFKPSYEGGPELGLGKPGHVGWHELFAADAPAVWPFYEALFGWRRGEAHDMGPMGVYQLFGAGGPDFGGMMTKPPFLPVPFWQFYIGVTALDAAVARATAGGGTLLNGPMQVPGGAWIAQMKDPQGAAFCLLSNQR